MEKTVTPQAAEGGAMDKVFWLLLAAGLLLFAGVTIPPGARQSRALMENVERAESVSRQLAQANEILRERERALQSDPFYNEAVLRARMKYTRPGEKEVLTPATADRRLLVEMPAAAVYVPAPLEAPGIANRITSWSLLMASGLLIATAFIFFDRPARAPRRVLSPQL